MRKTGAIFVLLLAIASSAAAEKFLSVSDIHFDPFAEPKLMAKLEEAPAAEWEAILASSGSTSFSTYGSDINDALLRSAIGEMKKQIPSPAFVLISGDFLAHKFQETYQQYASDKSQAAYTAFVTKTIAYVTAVLRRAYPDTPIYPALGNNDSDCGDYAIAPDSVFLANVRDVWKPMVRSRSFDRRFTTGGYYHADVRTLKNVRVIALNTNFFSTNYKNPCGTPGADAGLRQLAWLDAELDLARVEGKRVWLLFHIPPGIDVFDTLEYGGSCPSLKTQTFWKDEYEQKYLQITAAHRKTILGSFAGHTHQDEFRFAGGSFIHITPSVTPVFGNNPAFEIVDVTRAGGITDYTAYHLPNVALPWSREYSFDEAYAKHSYTTATLTDLERAIGKDPTTRTKYFDYYSSGAPKASADALAKWRGYWCGLRTMPAATFTTCACAQ
jgi:sphingomyelin phosphodiesterase acid-like 3